MVNFLTTTSTESFRTTKGSHYILRRVIRIFDLIGGWQPGDRKYPLCLLLFFNAMVIIVIPQIYAASITTDLPSLLTKLHYPLEFTCAFIKSILFFKNRDAIRQLLIDIDQDFEFEIPSMTRAAIIQEQDFKFRIPFGLYYFGGAVLPTGNYLTGLIRGEFPDKSDYGVDRQISNPIFVVLATYNWLSFFSAVMFHISLDAMVSGVFCSIEMRLKMLMEHQKKLGTYQANNFQDIRVIVIEFQKIKNFKARAEKIVNGTVLIQSLLSAVIISIGLVVLTKVSIFVNPIEIMFVPIIVFELWTYMFYTNELTETSNSLIFAFEQSNWLELSVKNKKNLILAQEGMIQPIHVTCFKWFTLNLKLFTTVSFVESQ